MSTATALLLVDCQEDYFARDGLQPPRETLIAAIADALDHARAKGWPVIHVRTQGSNAMPHRRGAPEVVEGTAGAEPPAALREQAGEPVFHKRFFSAFDAAGLEDELRSRGVRTLLIAGVHSHACIQASAIDAYSRGLEVVIGQDLVGSYDPAHAAHALAWLDGRAAIVRPSAAILGKAARPWEHRNPCDCNEVLGEVPIQPDSQVAGTAQRLEGQPVPSLAERISHLRAWHRNLAATKDRCVEALVRDLGKPRVDAEGEVDYGLGLLNHVADTLEDEEASGTRRVRYRPVGIAGLITPWNNPFAIPIAKIAPALGYGNSVLWKPALPGSRLAARLHQSLVESGLGERVAMVTGDAATGRAVLANAGLVSFTGSVPVGQMIVAEAGRRALPVQAELGGSNAAIIDSSADLDAAAEDLAAAIFSFAGQRCTAIRRVLVIDSVHDGFVARLVAAIERLRIGRPADPATQVGPVLDKPRQQSFLAQARNSGGKILAGGEVPNGMPESGCWMMPTLLADLADDHALLNREMFGPLAALVRVPDMNSAIATHNATGMGLLGALFSDDEASKQIFLGQAEAGILSINHARPPFAPEGPFTGWKASGYGPPEHGRWNRDFYTRTQAIYGD